MHERSFICSGLTIFEMPAPPLQHNFHHKKINFHHYLSMRHNPSVIANNSCIFILRKCLMAAHSSSITSIYSTPVLIPRLWPASHLASFSGPAQLSVLQATESWAGPGNETIVCHLTQKQIFTLIAGYIGSIGHKAPEEIKLAKR